ncbi:Adenosylcobinamide amidohydrolase [Dehalogenimonas formicexedens]|uniref:Adenosylcobinamide amidohydrolase n=2 Tax=Dehalogenimonas TaxID=670486 RepID=A0A1P8FA11_9CHLR|nr:MULTISPECIES: adenosylcobinamide amidohydrolase [Dehalogenimonas]APV45295.1 Adenosylcobinamide amidohydrolase [Dehalogenimonas formicexedens]KTB49100.1 adenosylcobinamide amidohydrolase, CbiZ [Dehalogenimonas alkenigignens]
MVNPNFGPSVMVTGTAEAGVFPGGSTEIVTHRAWNTDANTLVIRFDEPHASLSGDGGYRRIKLVCNSYMPKDLCDHLHFHDLSYDNYLKDLVKVIADRYGVPTREVTTLATGVDMKDMSQASESFQNFWVHSWVTAGFRHNAMRAGVDKACGTEVEGKYQPCGTINIVLTTNARLSLGTMASSFITATEAKDVALQDLGIHSSFNPTLQATGTGTDQIIVVSGSEFKCRYAGGHTKLGELMASTVTKACKIAFGKQLAKDPNYHLEGGLKK